jgi:hypothetical protein
VKSRPEEEEHLHGSLNRSSMGIQVLGCTGPTGMQSGCLLRSPIGIRSISDQLAECPKAAFEVPEIN